MTSYLYCLVPAPGNGKLVTRGLHPVDTLDGGIVLSNGDCLVRLEVPQLTGFVT